MRLSVFLNWRQFFSSLSLSFSLHLLARLALLLIRIWHANEYYLLPPLETACEFAWQPIRLAFRTRLAVPYSSLLDPQCTLSTLRIYPNIPHLSYASFAGKCKTVLHTPVVMKRATKNPLTHIYAHFNATTWLSSICLADTHIYYIVLYLCECDNNDNNGSNNGIPT